jgi:uncharacterized protein YfdQ (DUF2303 family)
MTDQNNAAEIINFAKEYVVSELRSASAPIDGLPDDVPYAIVPVGLRLQSLKPLLEEWRQTPERVKGTTNLQTLDSLINFTNRFKGPDSALFCDWNAPSLQVVVDYHRIDSADRARWCQHRGLYDFPLSDEWKAWSGINGSELSQSEFAEFIEDHLVDVRNPEDVGEAARPLMEALELTLAAPSKLLALSRGLSLRDNVSVQQSVALATGETQFTFASEHTDQAGQKINVPRAFVIGIPIFVGGRVGYPIAVRLRYRLQGSRLTWILMLHQGTRCVRDAIQGAASEAAAETKLPLFWGSPE